MTGLRWIAILTLALIAGCSSGNRYPAGGFLGVWSPRGCDSCLHDDCDECQSCNSCEPGCCPPGGCSDGQCGGCSNGCSECDDDCRPCRGCYPCGYEHCKDSFITGHSARKCARNAIEATGLKNMPSDFRDGFIQAYEDIADGQSGATPPVPPSKYWTAYYRSAEGKQHAQQWFNGYRVGASSALGKKPMYYGPIADSGVAYRPEPVPRSAATANYYGGGAPMVPQSDVYYPPVNGQSPMMGVQPGVPVPAPQSVPYPNPMSQPLPPAPTGPMTEPQTIQQRATVPPSTAQAPNHPMSTVAHQPLQPVSQTWPVVSGGGQAAADAPLRAAVMNPSATASPMAQFMPTGASVTQPVNAGQLQPSTTGSQLQSPMTSANYQPAVAAPPVSMTSPNPGGVVPAVTAAPGPAQMTYGVTPSGQVHPMPSSTMPMSNPAYGMSPGYLTPVSPSYRPQMPSAYQNYRN